jgi:hypothetical protein
VKEICPLCEEEQELENCEIVEVVGTGRHYYYYPKLCVECCKKAQCARPGSKERKEIMDTLREKDAISD